MTTTQIRFLERLQPEDSFVSNDTAKIISQRLQLNGKTLSELRQTRNDVVKWWRAWEESQSLTFEASERVYTIMSMVTAVIDYKIMKGGGMI
jgi:hypothetical protein